MRHRAGRGPQRRREKREKRTEERKPTLTRTTRSVEEALERGRDVARRRKPRQKHELRPAFDELGRGGGPLGVGAALAWFEKRRGRYVIGGGVVLKREKVEWTADEAELRERRGLRSAGGVV